MNTPRTMSTSSDTLNMSKRLTDLETECSVFEQQSRQAGAASQTATTMETYSKLSHKVTQSFEEWTQQHELYKRMLDSTSELSESNVPSCSIPESLTTVNELAAKLEYEIELLQAGKGSFDTAMNLWNKYNSMDVHLQRRLKDSPREVIESS